MGMFSNQSIGDKTFDIINTILLSIIFLIVLYPLYFVVIASFSSPSAIMGGEVWFIPKDVTLEGYRRVINNKSILSGYKNSIIYTVVGTAVNLAMTIMGAYPLSRKDFYGRNFFTAIFTFTMFFSGGLIPSYLVIKDLGLINNFWVMILPTAVGMWNIIIMRTFFQNTIPIELQESAMIDGARNIRILISIVLPLSTPIIAVMVLFYGVDHWNAYFNALLYLSDRSRFPLQLILREILIQDQLDIQMIERGEESALAKMMMSESIKYAVIIVASVPVMCLYPFLQKYFVKGVMVGAIKG